jgi:sugar lactone lactonase YvrE
MDANRRDERICRAGRRRAASAMLAVAALAWSALHPVSVEAQVCPGDCNGDDEVRIDEALLGVMVALGKAPLESCAAMDSNQDGRVGVAELVDAVGSARYGCGPALVVFESLGLEPEGVEYDSARRRFVVGSRSQGVIHMVDDEGNLTVLVSDPGLTTTLGLHIDRRTNRLLAAGLRAGATDAALGIYDLESGDTIDVVDLTPVALPGSHLANDVVTDAAGNAYVTDTLRASIYRVDPDGNAALFASGPMLAGANGIEIHDDRFLIVATLAGQSLLRVPLDDPGSIAAVETAMPVSGDGIVFAANGDLAVVGGFNNPDTVLRLRSDDDWRSASLVGTWDSTEAGAGTPTTAAARGAQVYVIFAHLFDTRRERYEIARAEFR